MKLSDLKNSQSGVISGYGSISSSFARRLKDLGFGLNQRVTCINKLSFGAPCVYQVGSEVFSLESSLSSQIEITD